MRTTINYKAVMFPAGIGLTLLTPWLASGLGIAKVGGGTLLSCLFPIGLCALAGGLALGLAACAVALIQGAAMLQAPSGIVPALSLSEMELALLGVGGVLVSLAAQVPGALLRLATREKALEAEVAERELAQQRLVDSETQLAKAEIIARLGSWHVRFGADESQDEWTLSEGLRHLYRLPSSQSVSTASGFDLMHPDERPRIRACWDAAKLGTGPCEWVHRIILNGETRWMHIRVEFIRDAEGHALEANGTDQDITERTLTETHLRKLEAELKLSLEQEVARLTLTTVAHELNQPLNAASTLIEAAQRLYPGSPRLPEILQRSAQEIQRAGSGLRQLLASLHGDRSDIARFDLNEAIEQAVEMFRMEKFPGENCISAQLAAELLPLNGRRLQLEKVVLNLIRNACDATGLNCDDCAQSPILVLSRKDGDAVRVTVEDGGSGVPEAMLPHLFEPFSTSKPYGLGLGLAVSRAIIESHGGRLWHEARPQGAAFCFSLPLSPSVPESPRP